MYHHSNTAGAQVQRIGSIRTLPELSTFLPHVEHPERLPMEARIIYESELNRNSSEIVRSIVQEFSHVCAQKALHIGVGTGFMTAVLSTLFETVHAVEADADKARICSDKLVARGYDNVELHTGDGMSGLPDTAPFDAILVNARVSEVPQVLFGQLEKNGILVAFTGVNRNCQTVHAWRKTDQGLYDTEIGQVRFSSNIGQVLLDLGVISASVEAEVSRLSNFDPNRYLELLRQQTTVKENDITYARAIQFGLKWLPIYQLESMMDVSSGKELSHKYLWDRKLVPIKISSDSLQLASTNPTVDPAELCRDLGVYNVDLFLVSDLSFQRLWRGFNSVDGGDARKSAPITKVDSPQKASNAAKFKDPFAGVLPSPAEQILHQVLTNALDDAASDIHFETLVGERRIRVRINGDLRIVKQPQLTADSYKKVLNVLKVRAKLDIAEHRQPQGGRFIETIHGHHYQFRVQTQPVFNGENIVVRLIPRFNTVPELEELGFSDKMASLYHSVLGKSGGLILVTGPTGCGKTTTLYAALNYLAKDANRKVISLEDPIEGLFSGIQQTNLETNSGFGFSDAMKHIVRQDPDVIVVGEVRDPVTALETIRASQTGHLVLSTLHSNGSLDAIQRLLDLELANNSICSDLLAVISQRLVKKICFNCRQKIEPDAQLLNILDITPEEIPHTYIGAGCDRCSGTGVAGRLAAIEYLQTSPKLRRAINQKSGIDDLYLAAQGGLYIPMVESFVELVKQGRVPLDEVHKINGWMRMENTLPHAD